MDKITFQELTESSSKTLKFIQNYSDTLDYDEVREFIIKLIDKQDVVIYYDDIALFIEFSRDKIVYVWGNNIESSINLFDTNTYLKHLFNEYLKPQDR
jgi:hypothetical protein